MKLIDLNILLYVYNVDDILHPRIKEWWERLVNSDERIGFAWITISGFIRISTNPRVMPQPLSADRAMEIVESFLRLQNIRIVSETDEHWGTLQSLITEAGTAGNLVTDAHLAAIAIEHGATLVSCDKDFSKFSGLRWENPLQPA